MLHRAGLLLAAAVIAGALAGPAEARRPNIVVILADDQRADGADRMPRVKFGLAAHGVQFANAFVTDPLCCPSRASILTGRSPRGTGVWSNRMPFGAWDAFRSSGAERRTIAVALRRAGYRTGLVGKYLNAYKGPAIPPGWSVWNSFSSGWTYYGYRLNLNGRIVQYGHSPSDYSTDVLTNRAVDFVRTSRGPFFLFFAPAAAHWPATPAPRHAKRRLRLPPFAPRSLFERDLSDKPRYVRRGARALLPRGRRFRARQYRSLLALDEGADRILDAIRRRGQLRRTLVIYTSDNGVMWGEHRMQAARKAVPYESSIRVPLVVRYDRRVARARTERALVSNLDVAATIAAAAGVRFRGEGRSLLPFLRDREPRGGWRERVLIESMGGESRTDRIPTYCAVRSQRHMYVLYGTNEEELYDLREDPDQLENLARRREHAADVADGRRAVRRLCFPPPPGFEPAALCTLRGTRGADRLVGGPADDAVCPRGGRDRVRTETGNDTVFAGARDVGGQSTATFRPAAHGAPGSRIRLGPGADRAYVLNGLRDLVTCGEGRDRVIADRFDVVARDCERVQRAPRVFSGGGRG